MSDDPVKQVDELDETIAGMMLVPTSQYIPKWKLALTFGTLGAINLAVLAIVGWGLIANNQALTRQIEPLQLENERQATVIADYEIVLNDAITYIIQMGEQIKELGGEPPLVELRPPEHPPAEEGD